MYRFIRLAVASIALATPLTAQGRLSVTGLLTEYRANPLGTDIAKPRLSWRIERAQRNTMQAAYQITGGAERRSPDIGARSAVGFRSHRDRRVDLSAVWRADAHLLDAVRVARARVGCDRTRVGVEPASLLGNVAARAW